MKSLKVEELQEQKTEFASSVSQQHKSKAAVGIGSHGGDEDCQPD